MNNGLGYKLANVPTITGLSSVNADTITSTITSTDTLLIDGVDVSGEINNQKARIIALEQKTTGISYDDTAGIDLTTIDNNVTITPGKVLTLNGVNVSTAIASIPTLLQITTGISYNDTGGIDLTTIDNNVTITSGKKLKCDTVPTLGEDVVNKTYADTKVSLTGNQTINGFKTFAEAVIQLDQLSFTSATQGKRQINNTFYNLYDNSAVASGVYRGRLFSNANNIFIEFASLTHAFKVNTSGGNILSIDATSFSTVTTNNPTISGFTDPSAGNSSNNIATTRWVQSAITASAGSYVTTNTVQNIIANKTFNNSSLLFKDTSLNETTITQNALTSGLEFKQTYINGGYNFITKNSFGNLITASIVSGQFSGFSLLIRDTVVGLNKAQHDYDTADYIINNTDAAGNVKFTFSTGSSVFTINPTNCSFASPPLCSVAPTTANMLCNKNYIDTNTLTLTGTQTVTGQKTFTNVLNTYAGSGASLTGVVHTIGAETIAGNKTFTGVIIPSDGGSNNSTIDQYAYQFNLKNNVLNNTTTTITGLIPSVNLNCIVRTDSVAVIPSFGFITAGTNIDRRYFNNFSVGATISSTSGITIQAINQIQSSATLALGTYLTTYIGTRYVLGTYVTADLGLGVYTITPNALVASAVKETTGTAFTPVNRPYLAGGAAAGSITFDYNTTLNLNCFNQSSVELNSIQIVPSLTTSTVNMFGDLNFRGQMDYNIGPIITASITLASPIAQHYPVTMASASRVITLPAPTDATVFGCVVTFKRRTNTTAFTLAAGAGTPFLTHTSVVGTATFAFTTTIFQTTLVCDGVNWCIVSFT